MADQERAGIRRMGWADAAWRIVVIAIVYAVLDQVLGVLNGPKPSLAPSYLGSVAISLVTGAAYALVVLPLVRRLPYRMGVRFLAVFLILYWTGVLSNLVEASVDTTLAKTELIAAAVIFAIPVAITALLIAWLLPAAAPRGSAPGIWPTLAQRPLLSWVWRIVVAGVLFAVFIEIFGLAWGPLISKYYRSAAYVAQAHTVTPPNYIAAPEEFIRGVIFVLVLLPVLAVIRGRGWPELLRLGLFIALLNAVLESWLPMLSMTTFPSGSASERDSTSPPTRSPGASSSRCSWPCPQSRPGPPRRSGPGPETGRVGRSARERRRDQADATRNGRSTSSGGT